MAHSINKLSARFVQTTQKPGKVADGGGLYLQVSKTGSKSWLFRFMLNGCSREMGLGSVNRVSLAKAREQAAECRMLLGNKIDPIENRISSRKSEEDESKVIRFEEAALRYIEAHEISWKNKKHASQWRNTLQTYVFPVFGELASPKASSTARNRSPPAAASIFRKRANRFVMLSAASWGRP